MSGNSGSSAASLRIRLRRSSALTESTRYSERRSSRTVAGSAATIGRPAYTRWDRAEACAAQHESRPESDQRAQRLRAPQPARPAHPLDQSRGDLRVLAEVELHQRGDQRRGGPALAAERLAVAVVHRVGGAELVGAAEQGREVELVAAQAGARGAEQAVAHQAQVAIAAVGDVAQRP